MFKQRLNGSPTIFQASAVLGHEPTATVRSMLSRWGPLWGVLTTCKDCGRLRDSQNRSLKKRSKRVDFGLYIIYAAVRRYGVPAHAGLG
jgi:hypothetical protein